MFNSSLTLYGIYVLMELRKVVVERSRATKYSVINECWIKMD